jgi:predicted  nucleic acid-binding Zn-ribbon protein
MPHICTRCNNVFESGEDILKGCPVCGWKKFMFVRKKPMQGDSFSAAPEQIITKAMGVRVPPRNAAIDEYEVQRVGRTVERIDEAAPTEKPSNVRASFQAHSEPSPDLHDVAWQSSPARSDTARSDDETHEKASQSSVPQNPITARGDPTEVSNESSSGQHGIKSAKTPPPLLQSEENKVESIKITGPGTYELNLPSLFERDELIMAVKEGTYFIDLSSAFRKGKKE